jgi:hypothetical protein
MESGRYLHIFWNRHFRFVGSLLEFSLHTLTRSPQIATVIGSRPDLRSQQFFLSAMNLENLVPEYLVCNVWLLEF